MTREFRSRIRRLEAKSASLIDEFRNRPLTELTDHQLLMIATEDLQDDFSNFDQITDEVLRAWANGDGSRHVAEIKPIKKG